MAFTNVRDVRLGGGLRLVFGDFTATVAAAPQTLAVGGGRILLAHVNPQATSEPVDVSQALYSTSLSTTTAINTLTIYTTGAITAGTFVVLINAGG